MAHLIEEYAKTLGVKIGKPILLDHYYPILHDKYITIHCDNKIDSKYYEYFPQVLNLVKPILNKNGYAVYQTGGPQDPILNTDGSFLNLTYKQSAHLIKNSKLHVGIDSLPIHIASVYDVPIVVLYSHIYPSHAKPYWNSDGNVIILEADRGSNKPSYSYTENPKTIRTIKPETIAQSILNLLKIDQKINFKTLKIGESYHTPIVEVVPNFLANLEDQKNKTIYIRSDLHFDEQKTAFWCSRHKCKLITKNIINLNLLQQFASNIEHIYFKIDDTNIPQEYFEQVRKLKINFTICIFNKEMLGQIRNFYFDFRVEYDDEKQRTKDQEKFNCKFLTNKIIISEGKLYPSEAHLKIQKTLDSSNEVIYDDDSFWKDSEHFYFYE